MRDEMGGFHHACGDGFADKATIRDGGKIFVKCSNCSAPLLEVWCTLPDAVIKTEVWADCPHCGDKSFHTEIDGAVHIGGTEYTEMIDQDYDSVVELGICHQTIHVITAKGSKAYER